MMICHPGLSVRRLLSIVNLRIRSSQVSDNVCKWAAPAAGLASEASPQRFPVSAVLQFKVFEAGKRLSTSEEVKDKP